MTMEQLELSERELSPMEVRDVITHEYYHRVFGHLYGILNRLPVQSSNPAGYTGNTMTRHPLLGKHVFQHDGLPHLVGRHGIVDEVFEDEKGVHHCFCATGGALGNWADRSDADSLPAGRDGFWCPEHLLLPVQS